MSLLEIRKEKKLRTVDIATKLGISQGYYSNLERGKRPFNNELLKKAARILNVPVEDLKSITQSGLSESNKLKSWVSNIKINGLPLIKAFRYYVESNGLEDHMHDDARLKKQMKIFIEDNIGYSVLAELSENKMLIENVRQLVGANIRNDGK
jgi:transcriptional regulator with XRE-family HTH domain